MTPRLILALPSLLPIGFQIAERPGFRIEADASLREATV